MAIVEMNQQKFLEAKGFIDKSFDQWESLANYRVYPTFANSLTLKCSIYKIFNRFNEVENEAIDFLENYAQGPVKMWLMQFLIEMGHTEYQESYQKLLMK